MASGEYRSVRNKSNLSTMLIMVLTKTITIELISIYGVRSWETKGHGIIIITIWSQLYRYSANTNILQWSISDLRFQELQKYDIQKKLKFKI